MIDRFRVVPASYVLLLRAPDAGSTPGAGPALDAGGGPEVLLQLREGTGYRDGHWAAAAAGHVEHGETAPQAACREAAEELGIAVSEADLTPLTAMHRTGGTGDPIDERVDFFFTCRRWQGEPAIQEPHKSAALRWFPLQALPDPVVPHERYLLDLLRAGPVPPVVTFGFAAARPGPAQKSPAQKSSG